MPSIKDFPQAAKRLSPNNSKDTTEVNENSKLLFRCSVGHDYETQIRSILLNRKCNYCCGQKFKSGYNDLLTKYPELEGIVHSKDVEKVRQHRQNSKQIVSITGDCGHWWNVPINALCRVATGSRTCVYCLGHKTLTGFNDLKSCNPELEIEYSNKNLIEFSEIRSANRSLLKWECPSGHHYQASAHDRSTFNVGCYYCSGRRCLEGFNDLATTHPDLAKFWDYEKNTLQITEVMSGMSKKCWWICEDNSHPSYESRLYNFKSGKRCPKCSNKGPSKNELRLLADLRNMYPEEKIISGDRKFIEPCEIDILFKKLRIGIEYNGIWWHNELRSPDVRIKHDFKQSECAKIGIRLIVVWEDDWIADRSKVLEDLRNMIETGSSIEGYDYECRR